MVKSHTGFLNREGEAPEHMALGASKPSLLKGQRAGGNRVVVVVFSH